MNALIFTRHAVERMREFGIGKSDVEHAVRHYETCVPARRGCRNYFRRYGACRLRITVYPAADRLLIVTVWKEPA